MPRRGLWLAALSLPLVFAVANCGKNEPQPPPPDAGEFDAGPPPDAGVDAGNPDFTCDLAAPQCDAGSACMRYEISAGRLGSQCIPGECNVVAQDCPASADGGRKCTYLNDAGVSFRACAPEGTAAEGDLCEGTEASNTCARGLICVPRPVADGGTHEICMKFCSTSADCAGGKECLLMLDLSPVAERPFVCDTPCDLLTQNCFAFQACYPTDVAPACYPAPGTTEVGAACTRSSDCVRSAVCVRNVCAQLCAFPSGTPSCTSGTCTAITVAGQTGVGACL